jgi:hypothetical protein
MTIVAVDLGKIKDYATINILEDRLIQRPTTRQPMARTIPVFDVPSMLTRVYDLIELGEMRGVSYPDVASRISRVCTHPKISQPYILVVDATGVGIAVCDLLRGPPYYLSPVGITISGGHTVTESEWGYNVPKPFIVETMEVLMETERFKIAEDLEHLQDFKDQILDFTKLPQKGQSFGAEHDEIHDDFVMGTAIGLWYAERILPPYVELGRPEAKKKPYNPATHGLID